MCLAFVWFVALHCSWSGVWRPPCKWFQLWPPTGPPGQLFTWIQVGGCSEKTETGTSGTCCNRNIRVVSCTALLTERGYGDHGTICFVILESSRRDYREFGNPSQCDLHGATEKSEIRAGATCCSRTAETAPGSFQNSVSQLFGHSKIYFVCPVVGV